MRFAVLLAAVLACSITHAQPVRIGSRLSLGAKLN